MTGEVLNVSTWPTVKVDSTVPIPPGSRFVSDGKFLVLWHPASGKHVDVLDSEEIRRDGNLDVISQALGNALFEAKYPGKFASLVLRQHKANEAGVPASEEDQELWKEYVMLNPASRWSARQTEFN